MTKNYLITSVLILIYTHIPFLIPPQIEEDLYEKYNISLKQAQWFGSIALGFIIVTSGLALGLITNYLTSSSADLTNITSIICLAAAAFSIKIAVVNYCKGIKDYYEKNRLKC